MRLRTTAILSVALSMTAISTASTAMNADADPLELRTGWVYRWGDSPVDRSGEFVWLSDPIAAPGWQPTNTLENPPGEAQAWVWFRLRVPLAKLSNPALFVPRMAKAFEVYVDSALVYSDGEFQPGKNHFFNIKSHLLSLPADCQGRALSLRVYSDGRSIGMTAGDVPITLGNESDLIGIVMRRSLEHNIAGAIIVVIGLLVLTGNLLVRWHANALFPRSLGITLVSLGVFFITTRFASAFLIDPWVLYYLHFCSYLVFPIGLYAFVNERVGSKSITRQLWWASLGFAVIILSLDLVGVKPMSEMARLINAWLLVTLLAMMVSVVRKANQGKREARYVLWAIFIVAAAGLYDLLEKLGLVPFFRYIAHWGLVLFAGMLVYVVVRRYNYYTARLERQARDLNAYAQTLEEKVASRTRDLDERNAELEATLVQLEDTQQQLVLREKMASIGDLVAGVAHEVNTPIGAVISASDGSRRGIDIIRNFFKEHDELSAMDDAAHLRKAVDVIYSNNEVVSAAGNRVAEIVRTLKNFARLDEAQVQEADLHEGLDSTLALLDHELTSGVEIVKDYGVIPRIACNPGQLNQVFMNVLVNACQAVGDTGRIDICTRRKNNDLVVTIADTGPGIREEDIEHVFDPGFTTKGVGVGTGLGLAICFKIIQRHNGTIAVENRPGGGAICTISIPVTLENGLLEEGAGR